MSCRSEQGAHFGRLGTDGPIGSSAFSCITVSTHLLLWAAFACMVANTRSATTRSASKYAARTPHGDWLYKAMVMLQPAHPPAPPSHQLTPMAQSTPKGLSEAEGSGYHTPQAARQGCGEARLGIAKRSDRIAPSGLGICQTDRQDCAAAWWIGPAPTYACPGTCGDCGIAGLNSALSCRLVQNARVTERTGNGSLHTHITPCADRTRMLE